MTAFKEELDRADKEEAYMSTLRTCSECGWTGTHRETGFGHNDFYCPCCLQEALYPPAKILDVPLCEPKDKAGKKKCPNSSECPAYVGTGGDCLCYIDGYACWQALGCEVAGNHCPNSEACRKLQKQEGE
jgi:hypothetical protein